MLQTLMIKRPVDYRLQFPGYLTSSWPKSPRLLSPILVGSISLSTAVWMLYLSPQSTSSSLRRHSRSWTKLMRFSRPPRLSLIQFQWRRRCQSGDFPNSCGRKRGRRFLRSKFPQSSRLIWWHDCFANHVRTSCLSRWFTLNPVEENTIGVYAIVQAIYHFVFIPKC